MGPAGLHHIWLCGVGGLTKVVFFFSFSIIDFKNNIDIFIKNETKIFRFLY